ncbi:hypothetical protein CC1G_14875 [Coprinopsis cinerea okayama7|uniref:Uncharacterized protein n=1 Tax=Coprinopsis cinerea (strain Okayama-7 / 130 / ATCC MYA-4618 / FGSC 9003) TaxID=240176 RepID=D6RNY0_COPC7|nr:hypothetical protein CC1G_14875 [Coprinopsis cinerea okayama7\|eukprot:XP_002910898.1 hypothetical protein CC1G_14875 [Coprinopsis cinerea okayama7\
MPVCSTTSELPDLSGPIPGFEERQIVRGETDNALFGGCRSTKIDQEAGAALVPGYTPRPILLAYGFVRVAFWQMTFSEDTNVTLTDHLTKEILEVTSNPCWRHFGAPSSTSWENRCTADHYNPPDGFTVLWRLTIVQLPTLQLLFRRMNLNLAPLNVALQPSSLQVQGSNPNVLFRRQQDPACIIECNALGSLIDGCAWCHQDVPGGCGVPLVIHEAWNSAISDFNAICATPLAPPREITFTTPPFELPATKPPRTTSLENWGIITLPHPPCTRGLGRVVLPNSSTMISPTTTMATMDPTGTTTLQTPRPTTSTEGPPSPITTPRGNLPTETPMLPGLPTPQPQPQPQPQPHRPKTNIVQTPSSRAGGNPPASTSGSSDDSEVPASPTIGGAVESPSDDDAPLAPGDVTPSATLALPSQSRGREEESETPTGGGPDETPEADTGESSSRPLCSHIDDVLLGVSAAVVGAVLVFRAVM